MQIIRVQLEYTLKSFSIKGIGSITAVSKTKFSEPNYSSMIVNKVKNNLDRLLRLIDLSGDINFSLKVYRSFFIPPLLKYLRSMNLKLLVKSFLRPPDERNNNKTGWIRSRSESFSKWNISILTVDYVSIARLSISFLKRVYP